MTPHCTIEPPPSDNPVLLSIRRDRVWETEVSQNPIRFKYRKNSQIWSRFCDHLPLLWPQGKSCSSGRSLVISSLFCLSPPPDRLYLTFLDFDPPQQYFFMFCTLPLKSIILLKFKEISTKTITNIYVLNKTSFN